MKTLLWCSRATIESTSSLPFPTVSQDPVQWWVTARISVAIEKLAHQALVGLLQHYIQSLILSLGYRIRRLSSQLLMSGDRMFNKTLSQALKVAANQQGCKWYR
jgi:hypothetical protein